MPVGQFAQLQGLFEQQSDHSPFSRKWQFNSDYATMKHYKSTSAIDPSQPPLEEKSSKNEPWFYLRKLIYLCA